MSASQRTCELWGVVVRDIGDGWWQFDGHSTLIPDAVIQRLADEGET